jgi:hypothetical protein
MIFAVCLPSRNTAKSFLCRVPHHETSTAKKRHGPPLSLSLPCATDEGTRQRPPSLPCATKIGSTAKAVWPDQMVAPDAQAAATCALCRVHAHGKGHTQFFFVLFPFNPCMHITVQNSQISSHITIYLHIIVAGVTISS